MEFLVGWRTERARREGVTERGYEVILAGKDGDVNLANGQGGRD